MADRMAHPDRFLLAGLMGWPVMHSRSPQIHNYWLRQHGLAGTYLPLAINVEGLRAALRALLVEHFGFDLPEVEQLRVPSIVEWE